MRKKVSGLKYVAFILSLAVMIGGLTCFPMQAFSGQKVVKWNFSIWGGRRAWTYPMERFVEDMKKLTNGGWQIKIHYGGALAPGKENLDGIYSGMFEAAGFCAAWAPAKTPLHRVLELPFIAPANTAQIMKMAHALWEHPALKKELLKWNAVPFLPAANPTYHLMGNKAIRTVADLNGARIRIGGDIAKVLKEFGSVSTLIPSPELYEALSRGTIDLVGLPYTYSFGSYKIYEVSKYMNIPLTLGTMFCPIIANKDAYDALPEEYKKLHEVWYDLAPFVWADAYAETDAKWEPIFRKNLEWVEFPASERDKLVSKAAPIYKEWVAEMEKKGMPGQEVFDYFMKKRKEIAGY
jgi:TRAP-type C4-dicarboxylate transport system substrate-binding protein